MDEDDTNSSLESGSKFEIRVTPDPSKKQVSVLMLTPQWRYDDYGIATITRSLAQNLRMVDPKGTFIKITCAVLEDDGKISKDQREDASKLKVQLVGFSRPWLDTGEPKLYWLDKFVGTYYTDIAYSDDMNHDFIIGHVPHLMTGCLNIRDICTRRKQNSKIILVVHKLPRNGNGEIDAEQFRALCQADVVLCLEKSILKELSHKDQPSHEHTPDYGMYSPTYVIELFNLKRDKKRRKGSVREIYTMTNEKKSLKVNGLDFRLAVTSVAKSYRKTHAPMIMLTEKNDESKEWEKEFQECLQDTFTNVTFQCKVIQGNKDFPMRKSDLFLLPLKASSPLFGSEALSAIAAGVPVLVSRHSPVGSLLLGMKGNSSVVSETDVDTWSDRIIQKITNPDEAQCEANKLREKLLLDTSIPSTHLDFINIIAGKNFK